MLKVAVFLAQSGYGVLLFDIRTHGESEGEVLPFGGNEAQDVTAAANYLKTRLDGEHGKIAAMGWSLGGQISILGAARTDQIDAVLADGPCCTKFEDWPKPQSFREWLYVPYDFVFFSMLRWHTGVKNPLSIQEAVAQISPRPILLIGGGAERSMLELHYNAARDPKELWIIPEASHIDGFAINQQEYQDRVLSFLGRVLLGDSQ
jgi:fermentation-respiration switch protein FrsA (DUF1100 family)